MKALLLKSIKTNIMTVKVLLTSTILLGIICALLSITLIYQSYHYHKIFKKQSRVLEQVEQALEETLDKQLDNYIELAQAEEPVKKNYTNYLKKNLGNFQLSFYTPTELGKPLEKLHTATRTKPKEGRTIAVDPRVIPFGTLVYIEGFGYRIAEDTGSAIKGNRIDIFMLDYNRALKLGRPKAKVWILGKK